MLHHFNIKKALSSLVIVTIIFVGCTYDVEEELYPSNNNCNITGVRYSTTINPILNKYGCTDCHSTTFPSGNISLETHAQVKRRVDDGTLWGAINHLPGFSPMPLGAAKMNACDISAIKAWIDAGSPNN